MKKKKKTKEEEEEGKKKKKKKKKTRHKSNCCSYFIYCELQAWIQAWKNHTMGILHSFRIKNELGRLNTATGHEMRFE